MPEAACRPTPGDSRSCAGGSTSRSPPRQRSSVRDLAIDGDDLIAELGLEPGPRLGRVLDELLEQVVDDPALNDRPTLLVLAQAMLADDA